MKYPHNRKELRQTIADLERQIETLVRRLGMIASSDVIENQALCETYIEMINLRTEALKGCESLLRTSILTSSVSSRYSA